MTPARRFEERDGWLVPVSFPGEADRLEDASALPISRTSERSRCAGKGAAENAERRRLVRITAETRDSSSARTATASCCARTLARRFPWVLDQTGALSSSRSWGRKRTSVLRRLTHLHELPGSGDVAHVGAHVLEQEGGYWIVFPQEYGHYLWEVAVDAAEPFGGGPVGVDAVVREGGRVNETSSARSACGAATS